MNVGRVREGTMITVTVTCAGDGWYARYTGGELIATAPHGHLQDLLDDLRGTYGVKRSEIRFDLGTEI
jgi:uncharacterized protein (DUF169 family)